MDPLLTCLSYVALVLLASKISLTLLSLFYRRFIARPLNVAKLGEWALVTGATDGIGKAYAGALAKKGLNIVLVSRTKEKLEAAAAELEAQHKIQTKTIVVDFTADDSEYMDRVKSGVAGLEIGVLVNNVGMSYEHPDWFLGLEMAAVRRLVSCNIASVNAMTWAILPQMVERKRGAVINVSSLSGLMATPLLSVYSGTKAYVEKFTTGLDAEYAAKGIVCQCVSPGYVVSKLSKIRKPTLMAPTPEAYVKSALSRLGIDGNTCGYWTHDLMIGFFDVLPESLRLKITFDTLKGIRKAALRKKNK